MPRRGRAMRADSSGDADARTGLPSPDRPFACATDTYPPITRTSPWPLYWRSRSGSEAAVPGQGGVLLHAGVAAARRGLLRRAVRRRRRGPRGWPSRSPTRIRRQRRRRSSTGWRRAKASTSLRTSAPKRTTWSAAAGASARCLVPKGFGDASRGCSRARPPSRAAIDPAARPSRPCCRACCWRRPANACRRCWGSAGQPRRDRPGGARQREEAAGGQHPRAVGPAVDARLARRLSRQAEAPEPTPPASGAAPPARGGRLAPLVTSTSPA